MAEIILDLSGQAGLADNFFGDRDMITPQPHLRIGEPGEMAQGLFNPYLRMGYMAPASTTSVTLTSDVALTNNLTSVVFDEDNDTLYFAERGRGIYALDGLTDTSLEQVINLDAGEQIQDLETYEVNTKRNLFYVYTKDGLIDTQSLSRRGFWRTTSIEVNPAATTKPTILASFFDYWSAASRSIDIVVPTGSNIACILHVSGFSPVTAATVDAVAMTQNSQVTAPWSSATSYSSVYSLGNVGHGTKTVSITGGGSGVYSIIFVDNASMSPVTVVENLRAMTSSVVTRGTHSETKLLLSFLSVGSVVGELTSITGTPTSYDEAAQTGNDGLSIALSTDGTKMYLGGGTAATSIYQYTLATPFRVSSGVTYASKLLNYGAQFPAEIVGAVNFNSDGTKMYLSGSSFNPSLFVIKTWDLSTPWDVSTAVYNAAEDSPSADFGGASNAWGFSFSSDGLHYYLCGSELGSFSAIFQYTLTTAWDVSTAAYSKKLRLRDIYSGDLFGYNMVAPGVTANGDTQFIFQTFNDTYFFALNFDPLYPRDISKCTMATSSTGGLDFYTTTTFQSLGTPHRGQGYLYYRQNAGGAAKGDVVRLAFTSVTAPAKTTSIKTIGSAEGSAIWGSANYLPDGKTLECGTAPLPLGSLKDNTWLTETVGVNITTGSQFNFIRKADNGFAYLFAGNAVHKIDGGLTGGIDGSVTKNVLLLPDYFTITDAVDFRSRIYMAVHQYLVDSSMNSPRVHAGRAGILVWDRISSQLGGVDFIEIPGVREIKKIYSSPDGMIKMLVISDTGLVELRQFGYNDSGGVIFRIMKTLGQGAEPQYPDGLVVGGTQAMWLANDGYLYSEQESAVTKLFEVKAPGVTTPTLKNNINSGALFYGGDSSTSPDGYRNNRESLLFTYEDEEIPYNHPTSTGAYSVAPAATSVTAAATTVTLDGLRLENVSVVLGHSGTPTRTFTVTAKVWNILSGTIGNNAVPNLASPVATSSTTYTEADFDSVDPTLFSFEFNNQIAAGDYMVGVEISYATGSGQYIPIRYAAAGAGVNTSITTNGGGSWGHLNAEVQSGLAMTINGAVWLCKRVFPFDTRTDANALQYPHVGDVYSTVQYVPVTSVVRRVRVYSAPITGTGTDVIATVKLYFNQSSTVGMTKSISKDEAKRGYVDFAINKPYIHAIQVEVEWATAEPLGADMYLPSVAIISHDPTSTSSPDNE